MEDLLNRTGKTVVRTLVKALAVLCTGVLSVIEATDREKRKGGK